MNASGSPTNNFSELLIPKEPGKALVVPKSSLKDKGDWALVVRIPRL